MFNPKELLKGTKVEHEHTDDDEIARSIAKDHLSEDKDYYKKLKIMEETGMKDLKALMEKKGRSNMDPSYKHSKLGMLSQLKDAMEDGMADDVRSLKKVSVASPSTEGLSEGLEKAKELLSGSDNESPLESRDEPKSPMAEAAEEAQEDAEEVSEDSSESDDESEGDIAPGDRLAALEKEIAELKAKMK